jgi:hypothetical protein
LVRDNGISTFYVNGTPSGTSMAVPNNATLTHLAVNAGGLPGGYFGGDVAEARIFTFAAGSFDPANDLLLEPPAADTYQNWAAGFSEFDATEPGTDFDSDGLANGIEYVVGGDPTANDSGTFAPLLDTASDPDRALFTYRLSPLAKSDPNVSVDVLYSFNLRDWTVAQHDPGGTGITESVTPMNVFDQVTVAVPRALAPEGKLYLRLHATFALPAE